tara:strand:- start:28 stop:717 length:690 start_codon:yes stop_codon:yes gene_type:complete
MNELSKHLKEINIEKWRIANRDHPFVLGIGDGSLELDKFQYYLKQDYVFLINYCKVLAIASSKSSTEEMMRKWVSLLNETLNSEMDLHRNFCNEFGISLDQLEKTVADSSTNNYCNFLIKNANENSEKFIAVSLLPCQWGYQEIAQNFVKNNLNPQSFHKTWIDSYASKEYQEVTEWLKNYVDEIGKSSSQNEIEKYHKLFVLGIEYEIGFWESAWNYLTNSDERSEQF